MVKTGAYPLNKNLGLALDDLGLGPYTTRVPEAGMLYVLIYELNGTKGSKN